MLDRALKNTFKRSADTFTGNSAFLSLLGGGTVTQKGTVVNDNAALNLSAFYNGITILCNDFAKLPKYVIQSDDKKRTKLTSHPVHYLISQKPNNFMTAFSFHSVLKMYAVLKGNGYAEIVRNNYTGRVESLELIDQTKTPVVVKKYEGKLWYHFDGKIVPAENMIHIPGFSFNGITGIGVIQHAANSLGVSLSAQEYASDYYNNKGIGIGVIESKLSMDNDAKARYSQSMSNVLSDPKNQHKVVVVDEGHKYTNIALTAQESQFLLTHKNGIEEVARWLNIPPHKLKSTENTNYSNMESQNIDYVGASTVPFNVKYTQELNTKLFTRSEVEKGIQVKVNIESLLQADKKTQAMWFSTMVYGKCMTPAEVREKLDLPFLEGTEELLQPVNMQTMQQMQNNITNDGK